MIIIIITNAFLTGYRYIMIVIIVTIIVTISVDIIITIVITTIVILSSL